MKLSTEEQALIRVGLLALQESDSRHLEVVTALGTLKGTEEVRDVLFDRIEASRALLVKLLQEVPG